MSDISVPTIATTPLARHMSVGSLERHKILNMEVLSMSGAVSANRGQGRRRLGLNWDPGRMAKFASKRVAFGMKMVADAGLGVHTTHLCGLNLGLKYSFN